MKRMNGSLNISLLYQITDITNLQNLTISQIMR